MDAKLKRRLNQTLDELLPLCQEGQMDAAQRRAALEVLERLFEQGKDDTYVDIGYSMAGLPRSGRRRRGSR